MDVKTLCLGVLSERPMSGYEIKKHFEQAFQHFFLAGFGSIYPALAELARDGLVSVESVEQDKRPDKKVYRITARGWDALTEQLLAARPQHRVRSEFLVLMYFAHLLPAERVAAILDEMIDHWEFLLPHLEVCQAEAGADGRPIAPGQRFAAGYGRRVLGAAAAYVKEHKAELVRQIAGTAGEPAQPLAAVGD
jgi:PadR family transcriptional regulator AphA